MHWFIFVALRMFFFPALLSLQLAIFHDSDIFHDVSAMPQFLITLVPLAFDGRRIKTNLCRSWWWTKIRDPKAINSSFFPSNWICERKMREAKGWRKKERKKKHIKFIIKHIVFLSGFQFNDDGGTKSETDWKRSTWIVSGERCMPRRQILMQSAAYFQLR